MTWNEFVALVNDVDKRLHAADQDEGKKRIKDEAIQALIDAGGGEEEDWNAAVKRGQDSLG